MSTAERSAFYLWFTWRRATPASYPGGVLTRCTPDDPAKDRSHFYKTDSEEVAVHLRAMLQETEGESPRFGFTPAKDLDIRQTVLADDAIGKYASGGYDDKGQTFFYQAWRLENLLRQKLGLRPMESLSEAELVNGRRPPGPGGGTEPSDLSMLSCGDLAKTHQMDDKGKNTLQHRLARWRNEHDDGWKETQNPAKNSPKFLYRYRDVKHICQEVAASQPRHSGRKSTR